MRLALLICAILAVCVAFPVSAHAQGAVLSTMSYYQSSQFTGVSCSHDVTAHARPVDGVLSFDANGAFRCESSGKTEFAIPYTSVKKLIFEDRVRDSHSRLASEKPFRSHRLTILYTAGDGEQEKKSIWLHTADWKLALSVASNRTGLPVERTVHDVW